MSALKPFKNLGWTSRQREQVEALRVLAEMALARITTLERREANLATASLRRYEEAKTMREVILAVEWGDEGYCLECSGRKEAYGHSPRCPIGKALSL
jgi:hypothetical protein